MISFIRGELVEAHDNFVVLDCNGIGYKIFCGSQTSNSLAIGQSQLLYTEQIFREDSVQLFGFLEKEDRELFILLCSVNGVGPKSALGILDALGNTGVIQAVNQADDSAFRAVSGVGPKTAKLIILTLSGKLVLGAQENTAGVVNALVNLGYPEKVAREAFDKAKANNSDKSEAELLKISLASLTKGKVLSND